MSEFQVLPFEKVFAECEVCDDVAHWWRDVAGRLDSQCVCDTCKQRIERQEAGSEEVA